MTLEEKAEQAAYFLEQELTVSEPGNEHEGVGFDPATILILFQVVMALIQLYRTCNSAAGAVKTLANPGPLARLFMRRTIDKELERIAKGKRFPTETEKTAAAMATKLKKHRPEIQAAIIRSGQQTTVAEMEGFYAEVREAA